MPRKVFFVWELTTRGHYAPSIYFDDKPGTLGLKGRAEEFRPIVHPVTDPELLAQVNASDGGSFAALAAAFPAPAIPAEPVTVKIEVA